MTLYCKDCGRGVECPVTAEQLAEWKSGTLVQDAMPHLDAEQREMFISRICGKCWDKMFAIGDE